MSEQLLLLVLVAGGLLVCLLVVALLVKSWWRSVAPGQALVISQMKGEPRVSFTGALVFPVVHRAESIDLSVRQVVIVRRGKEGVICRDNIRADMAVGFFVRVGPTTEDVLAVARSIGCERASEQATLDVLFGAKFAEAIKTVGKRHDFEELFTLRAELKDELIALIGPDLNGYRLDDVVIDSLEQTPLDALDPNNILDAQGIKKILAQTADLDRVRRRAGAGPGPAPTEPLQAAFDRAGLRDIRVITEVSCDVGGELASLSVQLDDDTDETAARLPPGVPRSLIAAVGCGALSREAGRATFRWTQLHVSPDQLVAGARLVRALRDDPRAYR